MKKLSTLFLLTMLLLAAPLPSYAVPKNKYKGLDHQSRRAQHKEARQMRTYAARQQRLQRKLNKSQHNLYKPKHT